MKIVVSSDWHPDVVTMGVRRFDEVERAVTETVDAAIELRAGLYVFSGDLCDPDSGTSVFRCVRLAINTALRLREEGISSVWIPGNHCVIEDGSGDTVLSPLRPLTRLKPSPGNPAMVHLFEEPTEHRFDISGVPVRILALPFTATSHTYDPEAWINARERGDVPTIVVGHLTVPGIVPGEETIDMPRGRDVIFPIEACKRLDAIMINGHYHRTQVHNGVHIPGALARFTFGEHRNEPSFLVVEV